MIKRVEFSLVILAHLLLVLFINIVHRGIVIWFVLSAKAFKGRYFCREENFSGKTIIFFFFFFLRVILFIDTTKYIIQNYHAIDPSRATA